MIPRRPGRRSRPADRSRVIIVGAGLGGLSAACHLAGRGHEVTVVERDDRPGGRAGLWCEGGYRFDTGPSVLTMQDVLRRTFAAAGADLEDHLRLQRLDPAYRACYADGSEIRVRADRDAMADEIAAAAGSAEAAGFHAFVDWVTELYRVEFPTFIERDLRSPLDLAASPLNLARLVRLHGFTKLQSRVDDFFADDRLRRLFSFQALYAGLSPLKALAIYAVISYMDCIEGVWFPEGGMHAIATGLADAATKAGVEFRYGTEVAHITSGTPCQVHTNHGTLTADAVVVNPDLPVAYDALLATTARRRVRNAHYSPSCIVWMLGVDHDVRSSRAGTTVEHHNIHFGDAWGQAFDELLLHGRPMTDPSRLVTVASLTDPTAAPTGGHTLYVLEPVPNRQIAPSMHMSTDDLTARMLRWAGEQGYVQNTPAVCKIIDPVEWERQGMGAGTPFALDHRFSQSGPFRPGMTDRRLPGVVFVGSSTRPGVGVPMVLISGALAADAVEDHVGR